MEWIEITAKSIDEAKDRALDELGVDERDAEFEILEEPKAGLFGRTKGEARLRARVSPRKPRAKTRQGGRSRSEGRSDRGGSRGNRNSSRQPRERGGSDRGEQVMERNDRDNDRGSDRGNDRGGRREREPREPREEVIIPLDEQATIACDFLNGFVDAAGLDAKVSSSVRLEDEILELRIDGDQLGLLIGVRGQTMTSLQEFVRIVVQRKTGATNGRIILDVGGYRERRKEALSAFTKQVAEEVISTGRAKVLEPMNPADRKIVHDTVNDLDGVSTTSEGMEPRRRVVISPTSGSEASAEVATATDAQENAEA